MRRALLVLLTAWLAQAQSALAPPQPSGSIHGVVKDQLTGTLLPEFRVHLEIVSTAPSAPGHTSIREVSARTDEQGRYRFPSLAPGTIVVYAGDIQSPLQRRQVDVVAGGDLSVDFEIPASPDLAGQVFHADGTPASQVAVSLIAFEYRDGGLRGRRVGPQVTAADGSFHFTDGIEGRRVYYLLADRDLPSDATGHAPLLPEHRQPAEVPTYYHNVTAIESAAPIQLSDGESREGLNIRLQETSTYCVDGEVRQDGKPGLISLGIQEHALSGSGISRIRFASEPDGAFHVCGLASGRYSLFTDYSPQQTAAVDFAIVNADIHHLRLAVDQVRPNLQLSWSGNPPTAAQRAGGTVSTESETVEGADMSIRIGSVQGSYHVPYDGPFRNVAAGERPIAVTLGPGCYVKEMTYNGVAVSGGTLHLAADATGTLRIVAAQGAGSLAGQIMTDDGPAGDMTAVLIPAGATSAAFLAVQARQIHTDDKGNFRWSGLAPGKYYVMGLWRSFRPSQEDIDKVLLLLPAAVKVAVGAQATATVKVKLFPFR